VVVGLGEFEAVAVALAVPVGDGGCVAVAVARGAGVAVALGAAVAVGVGVAGGRVSLLEHAVRPIQSTATTDMPRSQRNAVSPPPTRGHAIAARAKSPAGKVLLRARRAPPQYDDTERPEQPDERGQSALPHGWRAGDRTDNARLGQHGDARTGLVRCLRGVVTEA